MLVFGNAVVLGAGWLVWRGCNSRNKGRGVIGGTRAQSAKEANVDTLEECLFSKR